MEYIGSSPSLPFIDNQKQFFLMRQQLMGQPTPRQSQVTASAATANIDNDQTDDIVSTESQQSVKTTEKKPIKYVDKLFMHYTHEKRSESFKRDMHQVYENVFNNTPATDMKLIVGNRNRRDTKNELVRKRPKAAVLQNKRIKNKYFKLLKRRRRTKKTTKSTITTNR